MSTTYVVLHSELRAPSESKNAKNTEKLIQFG